MGSFVFVVAFVFFMLSTNVNSKHVFVVFWGAAAGDVLFFVFDLENGKIKKFATNGSRRKQNYKIVFCVN